MNRLKEIVESPYGTPDMIYFIQINVSGADIDLIADELGIDRELAWERMDEWGKAIEQTMSMYTMEQVTDVIRDGQP